MNGLLSTKQAAGILGISPRKLWELTNRGEIPRVQIGRRVLYDHEDLAAFIRSRKRGGRLKSRSED